jgi:2-amino-4-hydroxy-6-hydroxymethyldihydropteridine diphosphokinase
MNKVFLGLGGNLNNRADNLFKARTAIHERCGSIVCFSGIYETEAWGTSSKNVFLNQVLEISTELDSLTLLNSLLSIEIELGRQRTVEQYSDRVIDLDILFFNDDIIHSKGLKVPHPQLAFRKFVLVPISEIAPQLIHPVLKKTMLELLKDCKDSLNVCKL